jgi:hypothetical protein
MTDTIEEISKILYCLFMSCENDMRVMIFTLGSILLWDFSVGSGGEETKGDIL